MADDNALALQIRANPPDIGAPLTQAAQISYLGQHARQMAISNDFAQQLNAARLGLYNGTDDNGQPSMGDGGSGMGPGGPGGGGILSPRRIERFSALDPAGAEKMALTGKALQDTAQSGDTYKRSWLAQKAQAYQALNDPGAKKAFWNDAIIEGYNKGYLTPLQASNLHGAPNDKMVQAIIAQSMSAKDYAETSGAAAGNQERAKAPWQTEVVPPGASIIPKSRVVGGPASGLSTTTGLSNIKLGPVVDPATGQPVAPAAAGAGAPSAAGPAQAPPAGASQPSGAPAAPGGPPAGTPGLQPLPGGGFTNTASPALINLNQGNQPKYLETMGEGVAKFVAAKQEAIGGVQQSLQNIHELRQALHGLPTGGELTISANEASKFLGRFNIDLNTILPNGWQTDPTKTDIAQKNIMQLAAAYAKGEFPTRITNNDMMIAIQSTPNLFNTPQANEHLLDNLEAVQRMKLEEAKFYRQDASSLHGKGQVPDWTMIDRWHDYVSDSKNLKSVPDNIKQSYMAYSELAAHPALDGQAGGKATALPPGALGAVQGPDNHMLYKFKGPKGFYWGDETGAAAQPKAP